MKSAFFTNRLASVREQVGVSHDVSVFLNRFMEEMYYTPRLLEGSTATELRFAYVDPINQTEVKRGYKLEAPDPDDGSGDLVRGEPALLGEQCVHRGTTGGVPLAPLVQPSVGRA